MTRKNTCSSRPSAPPRNRAEGRDRRLPRAPPRHPRRDRRARPRAPAPRRRAGPARSTSLPCRVESRARDQLGRAALKVLLGSDGRMSAPEFQKALRGVGHPSRRWARRSAEDRCFRKAEVVGSNPTVSIVAKTPSRPDPREGTVPPGIHLPPDYEAVMGMNTGPSRGVRMLLRKGLACLTTSCRKGRGRRKPPTDWSPDRSPRPCPREVQRGTPAEKKLRPTPQFVLRVTGFRGPKKIGPRSVDGAGAVPRLESLWSTGLQSSQARRDSRSAISRGRQLNFTSGLRPEASLRF